MTLRPLELPLIRQLRGDPSGRGLAARSERSATLRPRTADADKVVKSICPFCAVGCGQRVYGDEVRVLDDRSLNGVFVNGERVDARTLQDGDELVVGRHRLLFVDTRVRPRAPAASGMRTAAS